MNHSKITKNSKKKEQFNKLSSSLKQNLKRRKLITKDKK